MSDVDFFIQTLKDKGVLVSENTKILDFGCGNGDRVQKMRDLGLQAFGCDLKFKTGENVENLEKDQIIRKIDLDPYRLPFEDAEFDIIISNAVLEHVQNKEEALNELDRILKLGGVGMHYFPSKYGFIETHVFVPFASVIRWYPYLYFWALMEIRKPNQKSMSAHEVVRSNQAYLENSTSYSSASEMKALFSRYSSRVEFVEKTAFLHHQSKILRRIARYILPIPLMPTLFRIFRAVVVITIK
ncbi:MAG: class I SAM-dependent methyltransferase [Alphaproteobacteria bacterium]|nr:class I SAM-dependent methyltransferase [Alphaproteobacteria bacterium]